MFDRVLLALEPPEAKRIGDITEPIKAAAVIRNLILVTFIAIALFPIALSVTAGAIT